MNVLTEHITGQSEKISSQEVELATLRNLLKGSVGRR
jgi:hypothetical protein